MRLLVLRRQQLLDELGEHVDQARQVALGDGRLGLADAQVAHAHGRAASVGGPPLLAAAARHPTRENGNPGRRERARAYERIGVLSKKGRGVARRQSLGGWLLARARVAPAQGQRGRRTWDDVDFG
eukprot:3813078-Prymnesium_polylepis.1